MGLRLTRPTTNLIDAAKGVDGGFILTARGGQFVRVCMFANSFCIAFVIVMLKFARHLKHVKNVPTAKISLLLEERMVRFHT